MRGEIESIDRNFTNSPAIYTIDCTEEQAIINEKVKAKVLEAKMLRFTGFISPRILMRKIGNYSNNKDVKIIESEDNVDSVNKKEMYSKRRSFRLQSKDITVLSL